MFDIINLPEAFYSFQLLFCVKKIVEKGIRFELSLSSVNIATFVLDFSEILQRVVYFIECTPFLHVKEDNLIVVIGIIASIP